MAVKCPNLVQAHLFSIPIRFIFHHPL